MSVRGARSRPLFFFRYGKMIFLVAAVLGLWQWWPRQQGEAEAIPADAATALAVAKPAEQAPLPAPDVEYQVQADDTLADVFADQAVPYTEIVLLERASDEVFPLTNIQVGKTVSYAFAPSAAAYRLAFVRYQPDANRLIIATQNEAGWTVVEERIQYDLQQAVKAGTVDFSLYASAMAQDLPEKIIMQLADVFAWDIDFARETSTGDTYKVLYEEKYLQGALVTTGRVLAAEYTNRGTTFHAYLFQPEGEDAGYYAADGSALQRSFLKAPVHFRYVSSGFANARFHPILGKVMAHDGIDYAADYGVPIISIGDGMVTRSGWAGGYGNRIEIRHNEQYSSQYSHMSAYVKGLKVGDRVSQGQTVGYVGSTGFSTGNHVHFSITKFGTSVDPSQVDAPAGKPLDTDDIPALTSLVTEWQGLLDQQSL